MIKSKIDKILRAHNLSPVKILALSTGKFNNSFYVELENHSSHENIPAKKIIIRVAPDPGNVNLFYENSMMLQEPGIIQMVGKNTSIPVPEIYVFDTSESVIPNHYMIMECIEGTPMSEAFLSNNREQMIIRKIGEYLRELHDTIHSSQFGYLGEHKPMKPANSWKEAFSTMWSLLIDDISRCKVYDDMEKKLALDAFTKHVDLFDFSNKAPLLHMDIWSQNIILGDDNEIAAIIDWDRALWGDPEIEFAVLDYVGFNTPAFWEGYGAKPEENRESKIKGMFYHLYEVQKYLVIWTLRRKGYHNRVQNYREYSINLLNKLLLK
ncbi:MAG: phosphotransferase family protein [Bacteroidales bacterium]